MPFVPVAPDPAATQQPAPSAPRGRFVPTNPAVQDQLTLREAQSAVQDHYSPQGSATRTVLDFSRGFNGAMADTLGIAPELLDSALKHLGTSGFLDAPGNAQKAIRDALTAVGVRADSENAINTYARDVGDSLFKNGLMLSVLFAMAPSMAASQLGTAANSGRIAQDTGNIIRSIGTDLRTAPATAVGSEIGATLGAEALDQYGPMGEVAGSVMGGAAGGIVSAARQAVRPALTQGAKDALKGGVATGALLGEPVSGAVAGGAFGVARGSWRGLRQRPLGPPQPGGDPSIIGSATRLDTAKTFAEDAVQGEQEAINAGIRRVIGSVQAEGDPIRAAERARSGLDALYRKAQQQADAMWSKVDQTRRLDVSQLQQAALRVRQSVTQPENLPDDFTARIARLGTRKRVTTRDALGVPTTKIVIVPEVSVKELRELQGVIQSAMRRDPANPGAMTDPARRNATQLLQAIDQQIETAFPDWKELAAAREYTRWVHDKFTRGPIGKVIERQAGARSGDWRQDPQTVMKQIYADSRMMKDVGAVADRLDAPSIVQRTSDVLRNEFRLRAEEMDAAAAGSGQKWLNQPSTQRMLKDLPQLDAEFTTVGRDLGELLEQQHRVTTSAFTRFAGEDPQTAVQRLFSGSGKVKRAQEITGRLSDSPEALSAFRAGIVNQVMVMGNGNPRAMLDVLAARDIRDMVQSVLNTDQFARLERVLQAGATLQAGEGRSTASGRAAQAGARMAAGVIGAAFGRHVASWTGGGTVQTPGIFASGARRSVDNMLQNMAPEDMVAQAVLDPRWERFLLSKMPENAEEASLTTRQLRGLVSSMTALGYALDSEGQGPQVPTAP